MLEHLKLHLKGKVVILGIGNTFRGDDGIGSLLAQRLKANVPFIVYDSGPNPENYLGKVIKDAPDNIIIIDAVDFGGKPGEIREAEDSDLETVNLFSTHNASISLSINYLKKKLKADIIILSVQPADISFRDDLTPEVARSLEQLEEWFNDQAAQAKG